MATRAITDVQTVTAVQQVRKMRGGAQSHLMRCREEGNGEEHFWVVKFKNNPQHIRVLANEMLATRIMERLGLPVPKTAAVEVSDWLVDNSPELRHECAGMSEPCSSGLEFGARFVAEDPRRHQVYDYMPESMFDRVVNLSDFAGMLCADKWMCNSNGRQAVYLRKERQPKYKAVFIDQGYCFNASEWSFPDSPLRGVYAQNAVYRGVTGWDCFEPYLSRAISFDLNELWGIAEAVPPEWYEFDDIALEKLIADLDKRRSSVCELIEAFRKSTRDPFPNWTKVSVAVEL